MQRRDERPLAVFVAAAVLAATGVGIAAERTTSAAEPVTAPAGALVTAPVEDTDLDIVAAAPGPELVGDLPERAAPSLPEPPPEEPPAEEIEELEADAPVLDEEPAPAPAPEPEPARLAGRGPDSLLPDVDLEAVEDIAARTGIPARALAAYAGASLRMGDEQPGCGVTWVTLAAVGWVESHHGTLGGRQLQPDGYPDRRIIGVPLDGGPNVKAIPDTDGGKWDGDDRWDRAVGPMQFIPSTWRSWQVDASGSGTADPQHIDDAALAAARYLCATGGGDLSSAEHWYRAVYAYNNSDAYVRKVLDVANTYAQRANAG